MLQTHYVVARGPGNDKQQSMVHISAMTFNELTIKALEHDVMSLSHAKHRDELYRYRDSKFQNLSNAA